MFFRHVDNGNTYAFEIRSGTGELVLLKMVNGGPIGIAWHTATAVDTSGGVNRVVIRCIGDQIRINVNGEEVFDRTDGSFSKGRIGIGALTYGPPPTVHFDNLLITASFR